MEEIRCRMRGTERGIGVRVFRRERGHQAGENGRFGEDGGSFFGMKFAYMSTNGDVTGETKSQELRRKGCHLYVSGGEFWGLFGIGVARNFGGVLGWRSMRHVGRSGWGWGEWEEDKKGHCVYLQINNKTARLATACWGAYFPRRGGKTMSACRGSE